VLHRKSLKNPTHTQFPLGWSDIVICPGVSALIVSSLLADTTEVLRESGQWVECAVLTESGQSVECEVLTDSGESVELRY